MRTLIGQRVFGMALGYEDLNDHEQLRHDPVFGALLGKLEAKRRAECAALAGKSTLNRLELHPRAGADRVSQDSPDERRRSSGCWWSCSSDATVAPPERIVLDLDATDDPLHGHQEGRFFHGYYDGYCYLPLYIFCGEHLLVREAAPVEHRCRGRRTRGGRARSWRRSAQRWPKVRDHAARPTPASAARS